MMVHVGLANDGSDKVIDRAEQAWTNAKTMQVSVSIARTNDDKCGDLDEGIEDYCISMRRAAGTQRHGRGQRVMPEHPCRRAVHRRPGRARPPVHRARQDRRPQPTLVKMPLNKTWPEFKDLLDVLAEHNVQGLSIANLQKDRTGLEIPQQWEAPVRRPVHGGQRGAHRAGLP